MGCVAGDIANLTLNSPFEPPEVHFAIGPSGQTGKIKAELDEDAWASLNSSASRPFSPPFTSKIAVKVINDYGNEVLQVFEVQEAVTP